jgi:hypothetical protein
MLSDSNPSSTPENVPWNTGRLTGQKRPLKPKDVWAIRVRLQLEHCKRDLACSISPSTASCGAATLCGCKSMTFAAAARCEAVPP